MKVCFRFCRTVNQHELRAPSCHPERSRRACFLVSAGKGGKPRTSPAFAVLNEAHFSAVEELLNKMKDLLLHNALNQHENGCPISGVPGDRSSSPEQRVEGPAAVLSLQSAPSNPSPFEKEPNRSIAPPFPKSHSCGNLQAYPRPQMTRRPTLQHNSTVTPHLRLDPARHTPPSPRPTRRTIYQSCEFFALVSNLVNTLKPFFLAFDFAHYLLLPGN